MDTLLTLIRDYKEACSCHGDQYGSPGCCDLCKRAFEVLQTPETPREMVQVDGLAPP